MANLEERKQIIDKLLGVCSYRDRLYKITTPNFVAYIAEYNDELVGYDLVFADLDPSVFRYGGNAYYITSKLAPAMGWKVEEVPR